MLIPDEDFPISQQQLSKLLSSEVINWLFKTIFDTHKVLRSDIEALPIHTNYFKTHKTFEEHSFNKHLGIERLESGAFRIKE